MSVKSVSKALSVLKAVAQTTDGMSVQEVSDLIDLPYATAHRFVKTLTDEGFLQVKAGQRRYQAGPELLKLFGAISHQTQSGRRIYPFLEELHSKLGETVHLAVRYGGEVVYLDTLVAAGFFAKYTPVGTRAPVHVTALGKALLAFASNAEIKAVLAEYDFIRLTVNTIGSPDEFWKEIDEIRRRGYAIAMEESSPGVRCIASIVANGAGRATSAISVSARSHRLSTPEQIEDVAEFVCAACRSASRTLGADLGPDPKTWYVELLGG